MNTRIALLIIYNHRFDKNILKIEEMMKGKFSHVFHIVPFYDGTLENVIPVYESSFYFSGYIAQAYQRIKNEGFTHFVFTSDDLILNPDIDENNIFSKIGINEDDCFIPKFRDISDPDWPRSFDSLSFSPIGIGAEVQSMLPSISEFTMAFEEKGINYVSRLSRRTVRKIIRKHFNDSYSWYIPRKFFYNLIKEFIIHPKSYFNLSFPMTGGYNDFFIIDGKSMPKFSHYCGIFSAAQLFVEVALPTAMVLSSSSIKTCGDTNYHCGDLWGQEIIDFELSHNMNLSSLMESFNKEFLYFHPVKLSRWKQQ